MDARHKVALSRELSQPSGTRGMDALALRKAMKTIDLKSQSPGGKASQITAQSDAVTRFSWDRVEVAGDLHKLARLAIFALRSKIMDESNFVCNTLPI